MIPDRLLGCACQRRDDAVISRAVAEKFSAGSRHRRVSGVIRPQDIASDNTVQHDRMAEARIAYGGRG